MAVTRHSSFDRTVNTIADRNALLNKVNHMTVLVKDAIGDVDAGAGKATYRWDASDLSWVLISRSKTDTLSFETEEITIINGKVMPSNIILDNQIWGIAVIDGDVEMFFPRMEDLIIDYSGISGLNDYNGMKLRFTYAYGNSVAQYSTLVEDVVDAKLAGVNLNIDTSNIYTKAETDAKIIQLAPATDISGKADISYVDGLINDLVALAPSTLNTFKEIADQLTADENAVTTLMNVVSEKQALLVSGTNIKTINGQSILGTGDIVISTSGFSQTASDIISELPLV